MSGSHGQRRTSVVSHNARGGGERAGRACRRWWGDGQLEGQVYHGEDGHDARGRACIEERRIR